MYGVQAHTRTHNAMHMIVMHN
eukprot:SAG31_NODE_37175_length_306_cov_1.227053_1_plen_21_part_10